MTTIPNICTLYLRAELMCANQLKTNNLQLKTPMPRTKIRPNPQLRMIVLEETNDGRDIIRYLKSVIVDVEGAPQLYGLRAKDYARTHKIAAARILARLGLEDGKRYLRRNYVRSPFKRVHPEDEDGPKRDMAASTAELYRLVKKETNDGSDIIIRFVGIMKGYYPEYKPHLRMAAAKELIRQIEFDYEEEPTSPTPEPTASVSQSSNPSESNSDSQPANPVYPTHPVNPASDKITTHHQNHTDHSSDNHSDQPNPVHPTHPASDKITAPQPNQTNHSSDTAPIPNSPAPRPHHDYAREHCAEEEESIYHSIIRRAADRPDLDSACREAQKLIAEFNSYATDRNPHHRTVVVPDDLLARSLTQRMEAPETYLFDPADYYDLDRDDFYYCLCEDCDECDEVEFFMETMRELEEETDHILEDP